MRALIALLLVSAPWLVPAPGLSAQDQEDPVLLGKVVAQLTGDPLAGVWIALEGQDWGTYSRADGTFSLPRVPARPRRYDVQALGYVDDVVTLDPTAGIVQVRMLEDPIVLAGFEVVSDRFKARRNAATTSVRVFDQEQLISYGGAYMDDFIRFRVGPSLRASADCLRLGRRDRFGRLGCDSFGAFANHRVCLDEAPLPGGWEALALYQPHDFYMVEVYGRGRQVRLYTEAFMERAAKRRLSPAPYSTGFC